MNYSDEKFAHIFLNMVPQIGPRRFEALLNAFGSASAACRASKKDLCGAAQLSLPVAEAVYSFVRNKKILEDEIAGIDAEHARVVLITEEEYPDLLKEIPDPPPVLYIKGSSEVFKKNMIAMVGTRKPTYVGKSVARLIAQDLARYGIVTVSGCARGIDTEVHAATIAERGSTVAVLGCGLSIAYPSENKRLLDSIALQGAVVSEFCMKTFPDRINFPRRNRIISGLSLGVIVIEAGIKSGALITARCALDQGREVFAVPGHPFHPVSQGNNWLLRQGARLVTTGGDVMEDVFEFKNKSADQGKQDDLCAVSLNDIEKKIVEYIKWEPHYIDELLSFSGIGLGTLTHILLELQMKGIVKELSGKKYVYAKESCVR